MPDISILYKYNNENNHDDEIIQNLYQIIHPKIQSIMENSEINQFIKNNNITKKITKMNNIDNDNIYSLSLSLSIYLQIMML